MYITTRLVIMCQPDVGTCASSNCNWRLFTGTKHKQIPLPHSHGQAWLPASFIVRSHGSEQKSPLRIVRRGCLNKVSDINKRLPWSILWNNLETCWLFKIVNLRERLYAHNFGVLCAYNYLVQTGFARSKIATLRFAGDSQPSCV